MVMGRLVYRHESLGDAEKAPGPVARVEGSQELWGQQGGKESLRHLEPQKPPNLLEAWWVPASLLIPGRLHQGLHESALIPPDSLGLVTMTGACCQHASPPG